MADAGFEPATGQPGRGMKTRPAILRNPSRATVTDAKQQTGSTESNGVSKRPIAQLQPPALKRTTCGDITNKHFAVVNDMHQQPELNVHIRAVLIDWMVEVQESYELRLETLYLAVTMVDRFLCRQPCPRLALQLLGATALLVAAKFEEFYADDFLYL